MQRTKRIDLTLKKALLIAAMAIVTGVALGVLPFALSPLLFAQQQQQRNDRIDRANRVYKAWNDMTASVDEENKLILELQENLKANPPHLVHDARRTELFKLIIAEHQRQLKDFQTMQDADR